MDHKKRGTREGKRRARNVQPSYTNSKRQPIDKSVMTIRRWECEEGVTGDSEKNRCPAGFP